MRRGKDCLGKVRWLGVEKDEGVKEVVERRETMDVERTEEAIGIEEKGMEWWIRKKIEGR